MKINELISSFVIQMSNEENAVYEKLDTRTPLNLFNEREQFIIQSLIRKSLVSKVTLDGQTLVARNDQ
jgi:hypothetical protein